MPNVAVVPPRIPLTDPNTGLISREWFRYLQGQTTVVNAAPTANGTNATGTWGISVTGSSGPSVKWATPRLLAGNSVDGSADVPFANKFIAQGTADTGLSGAQFLGALATGILKNTTTAGTLSIAVAGDFPTLNQNTTGSAAKWTTARSLAGNSVDGSTDVAFPNKFIVQGTADAGLTGAQFMGALGTGIVKNTITTGVQSIAVAGDFPTLNQNTTGTSGGLTGAPDVTVGNVTLSTVGKKFSIKEGSNASMGIATLVGGTVVVSNTLVTANSRIFLTIDSPGGTLGSAYVSARTAGTSFTITSTNALDTSNVAWLIVEPA